MHSPHKKLVWYIDNLGNRKLAQVVPNGTGPVTPPLSPPRDFKAVGHEDGTATLSWTVPLHDGGSPILNYHIGRDGNDTAGTGPWDGLRSATTFVTSMSRLINGATYNVFVSAVTASTESLQATATFTVPEKEVLTPPPSTPNSPYSFDPVQAPDGAPLVFGHVMSNYYASDNDRSFPLLFQGEIAADGDRYAKNNNFTLKDCGKFWRVTSTGKCWVWNGAAWDDYGTMPAYTKLGVHYPNPKDYQQRHLLPPAMARPDEQHYMAHDRDRVIPPPRHGGTKAQWMVENALREVREWWASGITVIGTHMPDLGDKPGSTGPQWDRAISYWDAIDRMNAEEGTWMRYIPQGDGTTSNSRSVKNRDGSINYKASGVAMGEKLLTIKNRKWLYKINGRTVLAPFGADIGGSVLERRTFWKAVIDTCEAGGMAIFFWPVFLRIWTAKTPEWNDIIDGVAEWGPADPVSARSTSTRNKSMSQDVMAELGVPTSVSARPSDWRPRQKSYFEAGGADTLDETWRTALGTGGFRPADSVQIVTMNDIGEHSHICRSLFNGWVWLDYNRYWMQWFQTKKRPIIVRDVLYIFHRWQFKNSSTYPMTFSGGLAPAGETSPRIVQTTFTSPHSSNSTPTRREIDIRADLKEAATVIIAINGKDVATFTGQAGRNVFKTPLHPGWITGRIVRNGTKVAEVISNREVVQRAPYEDLSYVPLSSARKPLGWPITNET